MIHLCPVRAWQVTDPNLMDIFLNARPGRNWAPALSSVELLDQHVEGVQVESVPQLKLKEAKSKCSNTSSLLDTKVFLLPAFGKYEVA